MITTPNDITTWLGLSAMDALASSVQILAEQHVKDYIGVQELEQQSFTEFYPLQRSEAIIDSDPQYVVNSANTMAVPALFQESNVIQLRNTPVRSITNVWEDFTGYFGDGVNAFSAPPLVNGSDYYLRREQSGISWSGALIRRAIWFPASPGSVKVTYVAGFTAAELSGRYAVFKTAVMETVSDLYMRGKALAMGHRSEITSETDGDGVQASYYQARLYGTPVPDIVADMLEPYVYYGDVL